MMDRPVEGEVGREFIEKCSVHFDDLDVFGMLYNGRYVALIDRGFLACMMRMGFTLGHADLNVVVREMHLNYGEAIRRIGDVDLILWLRQISRSSATFDFVVKTNETEHASGHRSFTKFNPATGRSTPWSEAFCTAFANGPTAQTVIAPSHPDGNLT
jgi:YbgC/YbaW family acyl-CoA thioester hydrolase